MSTHTQVECLGFRGEVLHADGRLRGVHAHTHRFKVSSLGTRFRVQGLELKVEG
jgi:hypothetical protein